MADEKTMEEQMAALVEWCESKKRERGRVPILERNEFPQYRWLRGKILIAIDMPLERADKQSIVYDSAMKCFWEWRNGEWALMAKG